MGNVVSSARSGLQRNRTFVSTLLYLLGAVVVFALVGLGAAYSPLSYKITFLLVQAAALLLGIGHISALKSWLPWYDENSPRHGSVMTLVTWLASCLGVALINWLPKLKLPASSFNFVLATLPFAVPYFFYQAYQAWLKVPIKQYKLWYYAPNSPSPDLARMDLGNFMVIHFWMSRRSGESLFHDSSSKAPYEMRFGDLFHIFLTDYNAMKPERAIQFLDNEGQSYGWLFYAKRPWWRARRYYDPDRTFRDNFLRQGNIIVARRVGAHD